MGWFDSEYRTTSNLMFQASGSVSLKSYYNFRKNIFYGSNFNTEITSYQLNKYKRDFKRDYNKLQLEYYGIDKNILTYSGEFISSEIEKALASKAEELGPLETGNLEPDTSRVASYPFYDSAIPRDETYYTGLPSSITISERNTMIRNEMFEDVYGFIWSWSIIYISTTSFHVRSYGYDDPLIQCRRKEVTNIYMTPDRRVISFDFLISKQVEDGVDDNDNPIYLQDSWQIEHYGYTVRCDVSAFTTHAIMAKYVRIYADNLSNVWTETIFWEEDMASMATQMTTSYPDNPRECLYMVGADILASDLVPAGTISKSIDIDPVASLKESNTNMFDPDVNYDDLTEEQILKQRGLEKMFRSLGGSTTSYRDTMANPDIDDLSVGSFIDFNAALKSDTVSKMGFDMFFYDDGSGASKSSGTGVASLANCSGGSDIQSDIPLGTSTLKIRAKSNQWSVSKQVFFDTYPTDDNVIFETGLLWRVNIYTSLTEKDVSGEIIQSQYKTCLDSLKNDYKDELGDDQYQEIWNTMFGHIEIRNDPEIQPVDDIVTLVLAAKDVAATYHTDGIFSVEEAHGSFSSLVASCENHVNASDEKSMRDKVIVSVPEINPTDADIITAVKKLKGKYEYFDNVSLKLRASSSTVASQDKYVYSSCTARNKLLDDDFGDKNDGALVFTFLRLNTETNIIDAVSLYSMMVIYESTDLNWTFKQWYGNRDKINFCVPIEFNSLFKSDTNFYEFMYLATLTNGTLLYVHETTEIKWYQTEVWGMIFQVVLVIVAIAITVVSFGSATSVSAFLVATAESIAYAMAISYAVDFIVSEFGLNPSIGIVSKIVISIYMGDQSGAMSALRLLDAGLKYYTAEMQDAISRAISDIKEIKKKQKDLSKAYMLEEALSEKDTIAQWAKEMQAEMQTHLDIETTLGVPLDLYEAEQNEELQRYEPEQITLSVSPSIGNLFSSGSKIVSTSKFKHDDFMQSFPRH